MSVQSTSGAEVVNYQSSHQHQMPSHYWFCSIFFLFFYFFFYPDELLHCGWFHVIFVWGLLPFCEWLADDTLPICYFFCPRQSQLIVILFWSPMVAGFWIFSNCSHFALDLKIRIWLQQLWWPTHWHNCSQDPPPELLMTILITCSSGLLKTVVNQSLLIEEPPGGIWGSTFGPDCSSWESNHVPSDWMTSTSWVTPASLAMCNDGKKQGGAVFLCGWCHDHFAGAQVSSGVSCPMEVEFGRISHLKKFLARYHWFHALLVHRDPKLGFWLYM